MGISKDDLIEQQENELNDLVEYERHSIPIDTGAWNASTTAFEISQIRRMIFTLQTRGDARVTHEMDGWLSEAHELLGKAKDALSDDIAFEIERDREEP